MPRLSATDCNFGASLQKATSVDSSYFVSKMSNRRIIQSLNPLQAVIKQVITAATASSSHRDSKFMSKSRDWQSCSTTADFIERVVVDLSEGCHLSCQRDQMSCFLRGWCSRNWFRIAILLP